MAVAEMPRIFTPKERRHWVLVFGSNRAGRHGRGAAADARRWYGAIAGRGEGLQGASYAIPTKDERLRTLTVREIRSHVDRFIAFAAKHPGQIFRVSAIGTGLAGHPSAAMMALFANAPPNCWLPGRWQTRERRLIVAGGRDFKAAEMIDRVLRPLNVECGQDCEGTPLIMVSGATRGAARLGERWAREHTRGLVQFPADWEGRGAAAQAVRNAEMAWYATDLAAFWDGRCKETASLINLAENFRLKVQVFDYRGQRIEPSGDPGRGALVCPRADQPTAQLRGEY